MALVLATWWLDPAWRSEEISTAIGEQGHWTLRDGSELRLNTASVLRVKTHLRSRQFELLQGEAAFHVAHGWRPFVVRSGDTEVLDIGTVFTVRRMHSGTDVTVLEGQVQVRERAGTAWQLGRGQALWVLDRPAEKATGIAADAVTPSPRSIDVDAIGAWQRGRLVFDGMPLTQVIAELQRYRSAPIALVDEHAGRLRLSGVYDIDGIESLIDTLAVVLPVSVVRGVDGNVQIASRKINSSGT